MKPLCRFVTMKTVPFCGASARLICHHSFIFKYYYINKLETTNLANWRDMKSNESTRIIRLNFYATLGYALDNCIILVIVWSLATVLVDYQKYFYNQ